MKLIVKQYLQSLRERKELDALLPQILSELGLNVITLPSIGTRQFGVDIAAVGKLRGEDKAKKLYLFSLKSGDLTRSDWEGTDQAIRPSLIEIQEVYLKSHVPVEFRKLDVVICVCMGGELREAVLPNWAAYTQEHTTVSRTFELWNGDRLAELLMRTMLGREILKKELQLDFQKSVAMVDQPDISYNYFRVLLNKLLIQRTFKDQKETLRALRQAYICLWVVYVWARDIDNYEAPYRISEVTLLNAWHVAKDFKNSKTEKGKEVLSMINQILLLHLDVSAAYLENKIYPFSGNLHALSKAVNSQSSVDINLAMFETLGRIAMGGIWWKHLAMVANTEGQEDFALEANKHANSAFRQGIQIINNNPILLCPLKDEHAIEICLFMLLAQHVSGVDSVKSWLVEMTDRICFSLMTRGSFPTSNTAYRDLVIHPRDMSDNYMEEAAKGSILYPFLAVWLNRIPADDRREKLNHEIKQNIPKCTMQVWLPDDETDHCFWRGEIYHGKAMPGLAMETDISSLLQPLQAAIDDNNEIQDISTISMGLAPLFFLGCRHFRMPIPPQMWFIN